MRDGDDLASLADRTGFGRDAIEEARRALAATGGGSAQFSHPELGGLGQWSPGMIMIGDMFNRSLAARVEALFDTLALAERTAPAATGHGRGASDWWPGDLGRPSATGSQNDMRYALFPETRRLAISRGGKVTVYDTGDHRIGGFGQQNGGAEILSLMAERGPVALDSLVVVTPGVAGDDGHRAAPETVPRPSASPDPLDQLERLAAIHRRGVIDEAEFVAKKRDLLERI